MHTEMNGGPRQGLRINHNRSADQANPLLHARKAQTAALPSCSDVESLAEITDDEMNLTRGRR